MVDWWLAGLAAYWGVSLGLLGVMYAEQDRQSPRFADAVVMFTVGPLVLVWLCGARVMRAWRHA